MDSPVGIGVALGLMGCFAAVYHPIGTAVLVEAAGEKVGRAMGINGVFGNFGVATAPIVTAFVAATLGWRWAFILPGIACFTVGLFYMREPEFDAVKAGGGVAPASRDPARGGAARGDDPAGDRRRLGPGVQRLYAADPEADAGEAGEQPGPAAGGGVAGLPGDDLRRCSRSSPSGG